MSEQVWWYATRAAGLMTWSTATASVIVGLLLSTRVIRARTGPWFLDLHRYLGGISVIFLAVHMVTLWLDSYVEFGPADLFIPGRSSWEPEAIAWGIMAAYVMIAVEVTSLLRSRIRQRVWRVIHWMSLVTVAAGTYHAWLAGSDVRSPVAWSIAGSGSVMVVILIGIRLHRRAVEDPGSDVRFSDQQELLLEMRRRLEELPVPEAVAQPELAAGAGAALPRRAPVHGDPGTDPFAVFDDTHPADSDDPVDPFSGMPTSPDAGPAPGDWVSPSPDDPFAAHALDDTVDAAVDDGRDLFDGSPSPAPTPLPMVAPAPTSPAPRSLPDPSPFGGEPVGSPWGEASSAGPFDPVDPPVTSITEPGPAATSPFGGPPPLPTDAIDPETGGPDEAAYTAWLRDWLAYAERYGDEAPEDPARQ